MTTGIDDVLLKLGQVVAQQLAVNWLADRRAASRRGHELNQLVGARFPLRRHQRDVFDALRKIEDSAAERLAPAIARAAHGLAENERNAALDAVSDALEKADLSDSALFGVDLDSAALVAQVRQQAPVGRVGLSDRAGTLYEAALERACIVLVHLVRELPEFDAASAVQTLGRLTNVLGRLDEVLDRVQETSLDAPAGTDRDEQFRRRYLESVARFYDHLEVVGLTTHHYEPRTTLTVAYLSLSVTSEDGRLSRPNVERMGMDWLHGGRGGAPSTENLRVETALGTSTRTVIRGEAGAGKSTLLRWLAVNAARGWFTDQLVKWNGCVPFLVKLRDFPDAPPPHGDALLSQPRSPPCGPVPPEWVHRQLDSGRALLLVDGVDELTQHRRDGVRTWLRGMLGAYPNIRVVVTSRPTAVTPKWLTSEDFRSVVLEPMTPPDVKVFLQRWHDALLDSTHDPALLPCPADEVPEHERALLAQLQSRPYLRALARSPLLCAMLCALNLDRKAQLPRDRLALYAAALDMLLERRDASRNVPAGAEVRITGSEKQTLLRELAWWLTENGRTQLDRDQAHARIEHRLRGMSNVGEDAETLLRHLLERGGVIRQPVQGKVDFVHRTFQEFLAAKEAIDRDSIDLLISNSRSDLWRETILMACAHASYQQRGRLLKGILDRADTAGGKAARQLRLL
ncbi:MAG: NACHT domain-containing protein, partial [Sciscionella sp.]